MKTRLTGLALVTFAVLSVVASAQEPTLDVVLARAAAYVVQFQREFSGIVAEEQYEQSFTRAAAPALDSSGATFPRTTVRRRLRSDILMVKPSDLLSGSNSATSSRRTASPCTIETNDC